MFDLHDEVRRWKSHLRAAVLGCMAASGLAVNLLPFGPGRQTLYLTAIHFPIFIWFVVSGAYGEPSRNRLETRLDFVRFSGELFLYCVLICLGGMVLSVLALVAVALLSDELALGGILSRLSQFGLTANRVAALGENLLLFGNLAILLVCNGRFLAGKLEFRQLVGIQMPYPATPRQSEQVPVSVM